MKFLILIIIRRSSISLIASRSHNLKWKLLSTIGNAPIALVRFVVSLVGNVFPGIQGAHFL